MRRWRSPRAHPLETLAKVERHFSSSWLDRQRQRHFISRQGKTAQLVLPQLQAQWPGEPPTWIGLGDVQKEWPDRGTGRQVCFIVNPQRHHELTRALGKRLGVVKESRSSPFIQMKIFQDDEGDLHAKVLAVLGDELCDFALVVEFSNDLLHFFDVGQQDASPIYFEVQVNYCHYHEFVDSDLITSPSL